MDFSKCFYISKEEAVDIHKSVATRLAVDKDTLVLHDYRQPVTYSVE